MWCFFVKVIKFIRFFFLHSSGDVDPVYRALRNTPIRPWVQLTGNKGHFTEDYFAQWPELASKEDNPKLAAKADIPIEGITG